jgi:lambda family phage portal protein
MRWLPFHPVAAWRTLFGRRPVRNGEEWTGQVKRPGLRARLGQAGVRFFAGAHLSRTTTFSTYPEAYNRDIYMNLAALRLHSQDLAQNNCYCRNYIELVGTHVVGDDGIILESQVKGRDGRLKEALNRRIEDAWLDWCDCVTADGRNSMLELDEQVAKACARDGEAFIVQHRGFQGNRCRYALELLDPWQIDWMHEVPLDLKTGLRTQMGIQQDRFGRTLGFWVYTAHPYDWTGSPVRTFVPAQDIIHVYREDRMRGVRGIPWMTPTLLAVNMLGQLLQAELASAIHSANTVGVIEGQYDDDAESNEEAAISEDPRDTTQDMTSEEVSWVGLAPGQKATFPNPTHPNPHLSQFAVTLLHSIAAGNQVAYHSLTNDVSQANYSSARVALLNERDNWRKLQRWFIHRWKAEVYRSWLQMAVLSGALELPGADLNQIAKSALWYARSWDWIDPVNDVKASILAIRAGLSTHAEELGKTGHNWRRVIDQLGVEQAYQREKQVIVCLDFGKGANDQPSDLANATVGNDVTENPSEAVAPQGENAP